MKFYLLILIVGLLTIIETESASLNSSPSDEVGENKNSVDQEQPSKDAKEWVFQTSVVGYFTWIDDTTTSSPPWWWQNNNPSPSTEYYPFDGFTFSSATTNQANFQNIMLMLIFISVVYLIAVFNIE